MKRLVILLMPVLGMVFLGCGGDSAVETSSEPDVAYLCSETKELVLAPKQAVPAIHPETGRATLMRALYCAQCEQWHAVPPPDVYSGNPLGYPCPKHRTAMQEQGPLLE